MYTMNPIHSVNFHASASEIAGQIREALQVRKLREACDMRQHDTMNADAARASLRAMRLDCVEVL